MEEAYLEVIDNGVGLPEHDVRERLTEPYITTRAKGTGLGLAIVWKIIEDHGGRLLLEDAVGGGARIVFYFPVVKPSKKIIDPDDSSVLVTIAESA